MRARRNARPYTGRMRQVSPRSPARQAMHERGSMQIQSGTSMTYVLAVYSDATLYYGARHGNSGALRRWALADSWRRFCHSARGCRGAVDDAGNVLAILQG